MELILGIDTSNYTTSLCAVRAEDGVMVSDARRLLPVESGQRGLRQSDALFFHVQRLPEIMSELVAHLRVPGSVVSWRAVGLSVRPRPMCTSYMPVFRAGYSFAHAFSLALGIPVIHTTHQEGHLAAAQYFLPDVGDDPFIAVHLSGGTSDVLLARRTRFGYTVETVGEGSDLHAGQFVDRVGVALGLPFPAGPHLEQLAKQATSDAGLRFSAQVRGASLSFSGPCSAALRAIERGHDAAEVALATQAAIANSVVKAITHAYHLDRTVRQVVVAGGVASNEYIRNRITHRLRVLDRSLAVYFAPVKFSSDNALGPATIAYRYLSV